MDVFRSSITWQFALIYFDSSVVFNKASEKHIEHARKFPSFLKIAGATFILKKCCFPTDTVNCLSHSIYPRLLEFTSCVTNVIRRLKPLASITELKSCLELHSAFRQFAPNFTRIAAPLSRRLKKYQPAKFLLHNSKEFDAIGTIKAALISTPVLVLSLSGGRLTLETHAGIFQEGRVILLRQLNDATTFIDYRSLSLTKAVQLYDTTQREMLAIVWSVLLLCPYPKRIRFSVHTDHDALMWIPTVKNTTGRLARRRLRLS